MPKTESIVINSGPLIAIVAALGDLQVLRSLYRRVLVPFEVCQEILAAGEGRFAGDSFKEAHWLQKHSDPTKIPSILTNLLDHGEAAVIQLALNEKIKTVCIDEAVGRRIAKLSGLSLTGSLGVLLRAKSEGHSFSLQSAIQRMREKGIWLSEKLITHALKLAGESKR